MADTEQQQSSSSSQAKGHGLTARLGPLPMWGWIVVIVGAVIVYKIIKDRNSSASTSGTVGAANNAASLFGTEGFSTNSAGQLVDNATGDILGSIGGGTSSSPGTGTTTAAQWFSNAQQTLFNLGYDSGAVDQALQDYASGNQLTPGEYGIVEAAVRLTGAAPSPIGVPVEMSSGGTGGSGGSGGGGGSTSGESPLQQAVAEGGGPYLQALYNAAHPPALPSSVAAAMAGNGEYLVDTVYNPASSTWLYLTQKGGVYAEGGNGFFGSVFNLPAGTFAGRTASKIIPSSTAGNGGYTIIDTAGETYNFGPNANFAVAA